MSRFASAPWPLRAAYLAVLGLATVGSAAALGLVVALSGLHRLSPHLDPWRVLPWFWFFRADPLVRRWLVIGALSTVLVPAVCGLMIARALRRPLHGAARWAAESDIVRAKLRAAKGLLLGRRHGRFLCFGGLEHVLVYAPTRSGKGVGLVIPNLLNWPDSVVVLDIKRENWTATAGFRAKHGQRTILFDPLAADGRTARYNPLQHIDRSDPVTVLDELQKLATLLFPMPDHGDPFWAEAARTGFVGVGALVAASPASPFTLGEIYHQLTAAGAREKLPTLLQQRDAEGEVISQGCRDAIGDFCSASENTFASIKQTLTARMGLWLNPRVVDATAASDFDLRRLRQERLSIYLAVSPDNLARVAPLYNLMFQQLIDLNTRTLPRAEADPLQVLVLLDEFARLGVAQVLAQGFAYVAGYGLRLMPVIQSPAQLRALYGPDVTEEIISNCGVEVVFAPKELRTAQDLSERLGYYTYAGRSVSRPLGLSSGRRSQSESEQRRALMLPQELIQLPSEDLIVLRAGAPPVRGRKITYYRERVFSRRVAPPPAVAVAVAVAPSAQSPEPAAPRRANSAGLPPSVQEALSAALAVEALSDGASDQEVEAWIDRYLDRSLAETLLEQTDAG